MYFISQNHKEKADSHANISVSSRFMSYLLFSALNCWVQSSNNFWFISMKSFRALQINPWIVLQTHKDYHGSLDLRTWYHRNPSSDRETVASQCVDSLVPVGLGVAVEGWEHDGQDLSSVVTDQAHDVLIVPVVQSSLCHLKSHYIITRLHMYTENLRWRK